jgi:AraC family transcriptional regulator of adaptative response/methylated-DNA-[protein]-cysteine methyltransferase
MTNALEVKKMRYQATNMTTHDSPDLEQQGRDYRRMEKALAWLSTHYEMQPSLGEAAELVGLSEFHFQRLFQRWVELTPKKYVQYLTLAKAKQSLADNNTILDATYEAGLSSPGRLHDLFVTLESLTPGEFKNRGAGMTLYYGVHDTPFSRWMVVVSNRGVCGLGFVPQDGEEQALAELQKGFEQAQWRHDQAATAAVTQRIFHPACDKSDSLTALVRGTPFQIKVWEALLTIPPGTITTYSDIARRIGQPSSARAVGNATGKNALAYLIPCHRVIQRSGVLGGYRWGVSRKFGMLSRELTQLDSSHHAHPE